MNPNFKIIFHLLLVLILVMCLFGCKSQNFAKNVTVFEGATLIIGDGSVPIERSVVVIENDIIIDVGRIGEINYSKDAKIINLDNQWLLPGFMNLHFHINNFEQQEALSTLLQFGVTTFRNTAAIPEFGIKLRDKIANGEIRGPRMFTSGELIDITNGFWSDSPGAVGVVTEEEIKSEVRRQAKMGVDYVKLYAHLEPNLIKAGIDEARAVGVKSIGHLGKTSWADAVKMGINTLTHSGTAAPTWELVPKEHQETFFDFFAPHQKPEFDASLFAPWEQLVKLNSPEMDTLVNTIVKHHVEINPTLVIVEVMFWGDDPNMLEIYEPDYAPISLSSKWKGQRHPYTKNWTSDQMESAKKVFLINQGIVRRLHQNGALITAGTDFPLPWITPGVSLHRELELLNQAGIKPLDVITIATRNGAEALGILNEVGTIEAKKQADFVILSSDPLEDIRNTRKIEKVYLGGKLVHSRQEIN